MHHPPEPEVRLKAAMKNGRRFLGYSLRFYLYLFLALVLSIVAAEADQPWLILIILPVVIILIGRDWKRTRAKMSNV